MPVPSKTSMTVQDFLDEVNERLEESKLHPQSRYLQLEGHGFLFLCDPLLSVYKEGDVIKAFSERPAPQKAGARAKAKMVKKVRVVRMA